MKHQNYKLTELFLLFVLFPVSLSIDYPVLWKLSIGGIGFGYLLWIYFRVEKGKLNIRQRLRSRLFWRHTLIIFGLLAIVTSLYVGMLAPQHLFFVPLQKPLLFLFIIAVYTFFSVLPQGFLYRSFFMKRYGGLFQRKSILIFINGILFSLAHLFFRNTLVLVITFIGGILFAWSYLKFKSGTLVNIQHALYGNWLFAVGMGQMLGFPGMEN